MIHEVSGHNFHGHYTIKLRGPAEGFQLSERQAKKVADTLCGMSGCQCGGWHGEGPADGTARIMSRDWGGAQDGLWCLVPAGYTGSWDAYEGGTVA